MRRVVIFSALLLSLGMLTSASVAFGRTSEEVQAPRGQVVQAP
jgi:hypothetical protein